MAQEPLLVALVAVVARTETKQAVREIRLHNRHHKETMVAQLLQAQVEVPVLVVVALLQQAALELVAQQEVLETEETVLHPLLLDHQ